VSLWPWIIVPPNASGFMPRKREPASRRWSPFVRASDGTSDSLVGMRPPGFPFGTITALSICLTIFSRRSLSWESRVPLLSSESRRATDAPSDSSVCSRKTCSGFGRSTRSNNCAMRFWSSKKRTTARGSSCATATKLLIRSDNTSSRTYQRPPDLRLTCVQKSVDLYTPVENQEILDSSKERLRGAIPVWYISADDNSVSNASLLQPKETLIWRINNIVINGIEDFRYITEHSEIGSELELALAKPDEKGNVRSLNTVRIKVIAVDE
jgi:hypothetical protein